MGRRRCAGARRGSGSPGHGARGDHVQSRPGRPDQARGRPAVRQHAPRARQRRRPVGPRADAGAEGLPGRQRHAALQRPHDPDLAHRGRDREHRDRPVPGPQRPHGHQQLRVLRQARRQRRRLQLARSSTGPTRPTRARPAADADHRGPEEHAGPVGRVHARGLRLRRRRRGRHGAREHHERRHAGVRHGLAARRRSARTRPRSPPGSRGPQPRG